jgi:hypothetical protein
LRRSPGNSWDRSSADRNQKLSDLSPEDGYDAAANAPLAWVLIADNLLMSVSYLEGVFRAGLDSKATGGIAGHSIRIMGAVLMLRGCAMECFLKALYLTSGRRLGVNGRYESPGGKSHDLACLAERVGLTLTESERFLFVCLGFWIEQGRYPVPSSAGKRRIGRPKGFPTFAVNWSTETEAAYALLLNRIREEVGKRIGVVGFE